eukprot:540773-Pyramimonas_sp.AAC.1
MTVDEYGGPKGINNMENARLAVLDFDSRPHKQSKRLRDAGVMQYKIVTDKRHKRTGNRREHVVEADADINADDYRVAQATMQAGSSGKARATP